MLKGDAMDVPPAIICEAPRALDGDTIACANLPAHVRLLGIDAPELPGHCRPGRACTPGDGAASARVLEALLQLGPVRIVPKARDRYGRILARADVQETGADLSCGMIATGAAVRRYGWISCAIFLTR
jgi:micrococcal nuclease